MKKLLLPFAMSITSFSFAQLGPLQPPKPFPVNSLPKLTYTEPAMQYSYNWWRRVNPANITFFPSLGISDLNNHDTSLASYKVKTVLSFQGIEDQSILPSLANDTMIHLEPLANLQKLLLRSTIDDNAMIHLAPLKNLTHLECINAGPFNPLRPDYRAITDNSMDIVGTLTNLEVLRLYYCKWVTDIGLAKFANLVNLKELDLTAWSIGDKGLSTLKRLSNLQVLNLSYTGITDDAIKSLAVYSQLQVLDLSYTKITDAAINNFIQLLPAMPSFRKLVLTGDSAISQRLLAKLADNYPKILVVR